jgi:hypothetical protein
MRMKFDPIAEAFERSERLEARNHELQARNAELVERLAKIVELRSPVMMLSRDVEKVEVELREARACADRYAKQVTDLQASLSRAHKDLRAALRDLDVCVVVTGECDIEYELDIAKVEMDPLAGPGPRRVKVVVKGGPNLAQRRTAAEILAQRERAFAEELEPPTRCPAVHRWLPVNAQCRRDKGHDGLHRKDFDDGHSVWWS